MILLSGVYMQIRYFQKGFNYSQDGTGNRLVIHLQGCNLHCPWCSNPEGMNGNDGKTISTADLIQEIISCKRLFFDGGGVTFTGGECTLQKNALQEILKGCKQNGIHTAIETNGTCPYEKELFENIDLLISDFKHYDAEKLQKQVGQIRDYQKNISDYLKSGKPVLIRIVLINGFNADKEDALRFAEFFKNLPTTNATFEFLPYHEYGKNKWEKLGKAYQMQNAFIPQSTVILFEKIFKSNFLKTTRS